MPAHDHKKKKIQVNAIFMLSSVLQRLKPLGLASFGVSSLTCNLSMLYPFALKKLCARALKKEAAFLKMWGEASTSSSSHHASMTPFPHPFPPHPPTTSNTRSSA